MRYKLWHDGNLGKRVSRFRVHDSSGLRETKTPSDAAGVENKGEHKHLLLELENLEYGRQF